MKQSLESEKKRGQPARLAQRKNAHSELSLRIQTQLSRRAGIGYLYDVDGDYDMTRKREIDIVCSAKSTKVREDPSGYKVYPVIWVGLDKFFFGVCTRVRRVFAIRPRKDAISTMIISDIIVDAKCEEACRCLNLKCDLNRTTYETFRTQYHVTFQKRTFQRLCEIIDRQSNEIEKILADSGY